MQVPVIRFSRLHSALIFLLTLPPWVGCRLQGGLTAVVTEGRQEG
jgi:hypothetical protein